jgi:uncharacterized protein YjcR
MYTIRPRIIWYFGGDMLQRAARLYFKSKYSVGGEMVEMSREQSPESIKAFKLWDKSGRTMKPSAIASKLNIDASLVRKWKSYYNWDEIPGKKRGAPKGNKNAVGNNGGAPPQNDNAVKHGFFRKFEPQNEEYLELFDAVQDMEPLEMLWFNVTKCFQRIIWGARIFHVTGKDEMIKELKKQKFEVHSTGRGKTKVLHQVVVEEEHEFQFSWDRYATAIKAEAVVMREFRGAVKQFLAMAPENDERILKLETMKLQAEKLSLEVKKLANPNDGDSDDKLVENWVESVEKDE